MSYIQHQEIAQASLRLLRQQTKQIIAASLDSRKLLLAETLRHRDWRGLAEEAELDLATIRSSKISPTEHCFHLWIQKGGQIGELWKTLECMDRYDVIDDTFQYICDDYDYAMSRDSLGLKPIPPALDDIYPTIAEFDSNVLTIDDQRNLNDGGTLQFYDALVLFVDEDIDFVDKMVQKLEGEYKLKLCLKDRDLVGGLSFESSSIMRLIEERCARVIIVLSPSFLASNINKFLTMFAHAYSIDKQRRILIPCMYKPCQKPLELVYCHSLDYFRTKGYWDYWKKLADSITSPATERNINNTATVREIMSPSDAVTTLLPLPIPSPVQPIQSVNLGSSSSKCSTREEPSQPGKNTNPDEVQYIRKLSNFDSGMCLSEPSVPDSVCASDWQIDANFNGSQISGSSALSTTPFVPSSAEGRVRNIFKNILKKKKKKKVAAS